MTSRLYQWLVQETEDRGWSIRELARRANLSHGTINSVLAGNSKPGIEFCSGIAKALHIHPVQVFEIAGILPSAPEDSPGLRELVFWFDQLDEENQEEVLFYVKARVEKAKRDYETT